ncbi:MAG: chemotaxis protein CheW [Pseudomonadota bacterium]
MREAVTEAEATGRPYAVFSIGGEDYAIDVMAVREIRGWTQTTALPHAPAYMLGVMNLRGTVVTVLDLAARLDRPSSAPTARHVVLFCEIGRRTFGLLVDAVADIVAVAAEEVQMADSTATSAPSPIAGVVLRGDRLIRLVDAAALLPKEPSP